MPPKRSDAVSASPSGEGSTVGAGGTGGVVIVVVFSVLVRFVLFFCGVDELLSRRKELVTPVTSYDRVKEGLFLIKIGESPYAGDVFHQPPLVLLPFYALQFVPHLDKLFFIVSDLLAAMLIKNIAVLWRKRVQDQNSSSLTTKQSLPNLAASIYLMSPLAIMSCVSMSTITLTNLAVILSVYFALKVPYPPTIRLLVYLKDTFIYAIPLYIRLRKHPMFLLWVNLAIIAAFKSYPSVGDILLQLSFLPIIASDITVAVVGVFASVLAPIFWFMWIYQGTGNANFYYAINLVLTVAQIFYIVDCIGAVLKEDYLKKKEDNK